MRASAALMMTGPRGSRPMVVPIGPEVAMARSVALVSLHGMGETAAGYAGALFDRIRRRLGADAARLDCHELLYQKDLQENQQRLWDAMHTAYRLDWGWVRRILLFSLSDAVGLEAGKDHDASSYAVTQCRIAETLLEARQRSDSGPVVVIAQSLGGQVFSSYLYDAQRWSRFEKGRQDRPPGAGIWRAGRESIEHDLGRMVDDADMACLRGDTVRALLTTGCNIPVFVAAHREMNVKAIDPPSQGFEWHNFFDRDDVLGWPLQPLNDGYRTLVQDHPINAGGPLESWNWLSHRRYWEDDDVLAEVVVLLRRALVEVAAAASAAVAGDL
jgi:hypothetical protein